MNTEDTLRIAHEHLTHHGAASSVELADVCFPDRVERPDASRSRSGHSVGRDLCYRGLAIQGPDGRYAPTVTSAATAAPQPPAPLFQVEAGQVVAVERKVLGALAGPPNGALPADGEFRVDPATGEITRVHVERLGRAQLPAQAPQGLTPEYMRWWASRASPEVSMISMGIMELNAMPVTSPQRADKFSAVVRRLAALATEHVEWLHRAGSPLVAQAAMLAAQIAAFAATLVQPTQVWQQTYPPAPAVGPYE